MKTLTTLLISILMVSGVLLNVPPQGEEQVDMYEQAVSIIKKYEGLHSPRHWPLVGYGHKVKPGEKFSRKRALTQAESEDLLRRDLSMLCRYYRDYGQDSLILAVLAYNIGVGNVQKSSVLKKLKSGSRDIRDNYLNHCRYRGKVLKNLQDRRLEEYNTLFLENTQ